MKTIRTVLSMALIGASGWLCFSVWQVAVELDPAALVIWAGLASLAVPATGVISFLFGLRLGRQEGQAKVDALRTMFNELPGLANALLKFQRLADPGGTPPPPAFTAGSEGVGGYPPSVTISPKSLPTGEEAIDL